MQGALLQGPKARSKSVAGHLLQGQADLPIQQVAAAFVPGDHRRLTHPPHDLPPPFGDLKKK